MTKEIWIWESGTGDRLSADTGECLSELVMIYKQALERIRQTEMNRTNPISIKKGTIVTCPNCSVEIAEVIHDLRQHDLIRAADFRGISQEIKPQDMMDCKMCGTFYFCRGRVHTKDGWMP